MSTLGPVVEHHPHLPSPPSGRTSLTLAVLTVIAALVVLVVAVTRGNDAPPTPAQPTVPVAAIPVTPVPSPQQTAKVITSNREPAENRPAPVKQSAFVVDPPDGWVESFYPIYAEAQRVFGVNWLLIASVHRQETAFSTNITTYRGLNFAGCCGGPMQFNVTNGDKRGRGSTWDRYRFSYRAGNRPARYLSRRKNHPSLYDDFDAIMAGAALLRDNGAGKTLDASAWSAAYDYYGHDLDGVAYASQVAARAIGWARNGFCATCVDPPRLTAQVDAAWGAPVRAALEAAERAAAAERAKAGKRRKRP